MELHRESQNIEECSKRHQVALEQTHEFVGGMQCYGR
jgi:hypothetical protein